MTQVDYRVMYEQKCTELNELDSHFQTFQQQTNSIIDDLQAEIKEVRKKNDTLTRQLAEVKEKRKSTQNTLERQLELIKKEKNDFQSRFYDFQKKVVDLENINEALESENRASKMMLSQYEHRVEKTMEELAMLQTELQESKTTSHEQIARLRSQLKQTEQQLYVVHLKHQKHNDESEHRRSRISSISSNGNETPRVQHREQRQSLAFLPMDSGLVQENQRQQPASNQNDFKRKPPGSFHKTIDVMTGLLGDLDTKMSKLRNERKTLVIG